MREHDQPIRPMRSRMWLGLLLAAALAARAQAADEPRGAVPTSRDPIELAGRRASVWDDADGRWVLLTGEAAAIQGIEGLRASGVVARITGRDVEGKTEYQVELYAEGDVRLTSRNAAPRASARLALRTLQGVTVRPYDGAAVARLDAAPKALKILERSGFARAVEAPAPLAREVVAQAGPAAAARKSPNAIQAEVVEAQSVVPSGDGASKPAPRRDAEVRKAQDPGRGAPAGGFPEAELPPIEGAPEVVIPDLRDAPQRAPRREVAPPDDELLPPVRGAMPGEDPLESTPGDGQEPRLEALPGDDPLQPAPPLAPEGGRRAPAADPLAGDDKYVVPFTPGSQKRVTTIVARSGQPTDGTLIETQQDGTQVIAYRNGVVVVTQSPQFGVVDLEADNVIIWKHPAATPEKPLRGPNGEQIVKDVDQPMEVYLEGNVVIRQDENRYAGRADQRTFRAEQAYYDFITDRLTAVQAQVGVFSPGLISPMKLKAPRIDQFHPVVRAPDGSLRLDVNPEIRADRAISTGSRFPDPAYQIYNRSITLNKVGSPAVNPNTGKPDRKPGDPAPTADDDVWQYDARTNFFYMGPVPVFYWPRFTGETDDLDPPLRMIGFRTNNYFGQQILSDWNGFKLLGIRRPSWIDNWNVDVDYLSYRTKDFPALGTEIGWFGTDFFSNLRDPYNRRKLPQSSTYDYFGYFDVWGLKDSGIDVLGSGPAVVTNGPPGAGTKGYQRSGVPPFQDIRGRVNMRHMQRLLPDDEDHKYEDFRIQVEAAYQSDRYFLEEYYKRLFDVGMDQETLVYGQYQKDNWAVTLQTEANLQSFNTDTQWLPKLDYYRLGDSLLGNRLTYFQHSGVDYANTHTDVMVNNRNLFAFMPTDPISNTSGVFSAGRAYTTHELDLPINIDDVVRIVPYAQGQLEGWSNQIGGGGLYNQQTRGATGRAWGAVGVHAESTMWKVYPGVERELLNIHGLNNKVGFFGDYRAAWANQDLDSLAIQDDLDDNSYEHVRRYFALTSWQNGVLPDPYDPRHLMLRREMSPITGTTDVQGTIDVAQFGIHQRLQTKRGPEGRRRIVDWMTLDASTSYFPNANRDNFGKPFGQTMYNYQWFLGDRTSIVSYGWFDYWNLTGSKILDNYNVPTFNPKGLNVITTGISITRPPRGMVFIGYSVVNTGPIQTSALNTAVNYWLSPKWYGTYATSYDFGNKILLGSQFSFTRIGADYLLSLGLTVDPQRQSYMFAFQVTPRLAPSMRLGSGVGLSQFDSRLAPTQ